MPRSSSLKNNLDTYFMLFMVVELASSSVDLRVTDEVNTSYNEVSFISTTSHGAGIPAPPGKEMTERVAAPIRSFFPETWLWELVPTE